MFHSSNIESKSGRVGEAEDTEEITETTDSENTMDLDRRVIYAAAATSLDSWDIENLRYIRQISRSQPDGTRTSSGDLDTVSYISGEKIEGHELDLDLNLDMDSMIQLPCLHLQTDQEDDIKNGVGGGPGAGPGFVGLLTHNSDLTDRNNNCPDMSKTDKDQAHENEASDKTGGNTDEKEIVMGIPLLKLQFENEDLENNNTAKSCSGDSAAALDNCYLLDVVTVRNESVLAFSPNKKRVNHSSVGSPSSISSASSTSSCSIHLPSDKCIDVDADVHFMGSNSDIYTCETKKVERDFFDFSLDEESLHATINPKANLKVGMGHNNLNLNSAYGRRNNSQSTALSTSVSNSDTNTNSGSNVKLERRSTVIATTTNKNKTRENPESRMNLPGRALVGGGRHCPFCDTDSNPFFGCEQSVNLEDVSMQVTIGGEPPAAPPRSPSPYYVRLRRDLLTALTPPPHHLSTNRPRNFSVNTHGQLTIDYSSNWLGLENYVKNLKR